jgi:hypothetical protein
MLGFLCESSVGGNSIGSPYRVSANPSMTSIIVRATLHLHNPYRQQTPLTNKNYSPPYPQTSPELFTTKPTKQQTKTPSPAKRMSVASKRLGLEYKNLTNDPPEGISAGPVNEDDIFLWEALIQGPEGTPFEGGIFPAELKFPRDYPLAPPTMKFTCEMWHPNGTFCISKPLNNSLAYLASYYTEKKHVC